VATTGLVLITGATGRVGSVLLDRLSDEDVDLRVLSHDESKAQSLRNRGVEVIQGDFLKPETLGPALDQVTAVFLATPIHPEQITQAIKRRPGGEEFGHGSAHRETVGPPGLSPSPNQKQQAARRNRGRLGIIGAALHPAATPVIHAEHSDGCIDGCHARQDLSADEGWQVGNDRCPRHCRSCREGSHRRGP